jgi:NADH-quinone oxidoreductase subunit N
MILQENFYNNFEVLIPEFFLILLILTFLLFGTFFRFFNNRKILITKVLNKLIIFCLFIMLILILNIKDISVTLMNGALFCDNLTQFIKFILTLSTICCYIIQYEYITQQKIYSFENNILILISLLGLMILVSSFNLMTLYLAIE